MTAATRIGCTRGRAQGGEYDGRQQVNIRLKCSDWLGFLQPARDKRFFFVLIMRGHDLLMAVGMKRDFQPVLRLKF